MSEDYLEFKMKPIHWILPFILAIPTGLFSLSLFITMFATGEAVHGMTAMAVLMLCGANLYAGFRNKNNATVLITKHALHVGTQTFQLEDIKHIEHNDPQKIILWLASGTSEYSKTLKVDGIIPEHQEPFRTAMHNINEKTKERVKTNDTGK